MTKTSLNYVEKGAQTSALVAMQAVTEKQWAGLIS